tara:strand:- start:533 stop:1111 length:579 start_codon:yes stop_codon:yes gene_type:complete
MALDIKLNITTTQDCKSLVIQDVTGAYNGTSNVTGWGDFNAKGTRSTFILGMVVTVYHFVNKQQYSTTFSLSALNARIEYPTEDLHRDFKLAIPASDLSGAMALLPGMDSDFDPTWETIEDNLYKVRVILRKDLTGFLEYYDTYYTCTCNIEKEVNKLLTSINLEQEDLADLDTQNALLAKSLLENLQNINI